MLQQPSRTKILLTFSTFTWYCWRNCPMCSYRSFLCIIALQNLSKKWIHGSPKIGHVEFVECCSRKYEAVNADNSQFPNQFAHDSNHVHELEILCIFHVLKINLGASNSWHTWDIFEPWNERINNCTVGWKVFCIWCLGVLITKLIPTSTSWLLTTHHFINFFGNCLSIFNSTY